MSAAVQASDATPERILQAAITELAEHGFAGLRTDRVVAAAGCNKQLLYYYYGSKAGLRDAVLERMASESAPRWEQLEGLGLVDAVRVITETMAAGERHWRRVLAWEGAEHVIGESEIVLEELRTKAWQRMVRVFESAQADGTLSESVDAKILALLFSLMTMAPDTLPQITRMVTGQEASDPAFVEGLVETIRFLGASVAQDVRS
ncbi:TetR/AcrR family transcriptional regulator [Cryptosporangium aurantiacum]|uniref:Transcriptional regulator, TetR family n=1 Tax=Cryptosporangium aurantiacum TaxID=134849 RepID=A0A1M7RNN6_9ACTN|nr:TetR/AcrR family transcriptional regulator [Cryptosporangium aurantiacum]SHN47923.1 transcriptional regulator, TetR family [Cryptosporangium aurantiacum]